MNTSINSDADEYVWLSNSFEMTSLSSTLRDLRKLFKKSFKELLNTPFNDNEQEKLIEYYYKKTDGRFFINQTPLSTNELINNFEKFIIEHIDKKAIFIDIDHAALLKASNNGKKGAIDDFVEGINELKLKYPNVIFVILTQLNRDILRRIEPKSNEMAIQRGDIYQSDTMFHIADYIYGLQNPSYFKIEEYRLLNPSKYEHLSYRFTAPNKHQKVSLYTENCIFVEVLKDRNADFDFIDLYTIELKDFNPPPKNEPIVDNLTFDDDLPF